jgi:hypothetical protein
LWRCGKSGLDRRHRKREILLTFGLRHSALNQEGYKLSNLYLQIAATGNRSGE